VSVPLGLHRSLWLLLLAGFVSGQLLAAADAASALVCELRNSGSKAVIEPGRGGSCTGLEIKTGTFEFALPPGSELGRPVFTKAAMEGQPPALVCQPPDTVPPTAAVNVCALEVALTEANADEAVAGLRHHRTIRLSDDGRRLEFTETLTNPTAEVMGAQFGINNTIGHEAADGLFSAYLPTERNVLLISGNGINRFYARNTNWDYQPVEGWLAILNDRSKAGIIFVLEPTALDSFHAVPSQGGCGWFWDGGILKPQAAFTATWWLVPVKGFTGIIHASRRLLADLQANNTSGGLEIIHTLAGTEKPLGEVMVKTSVWGARTKKTMELTPVKLMAVGLDPVTGTTVMAQPLNEPMVFRVEAAGKDWTETYETYREGEFRTTIYPGYPYEPEYRRTKPKKK